jgi:hypothetical protein
MLLRRKCEARRKRKNRSFEAFFAISSKKRDHIEQAQRDFNAMHGADTEFRYPM